MLANDACSKKVRIFITTFEKEMERKQRDTSHKYICSICTNSRSKNIDKNKDNRRRKTKSCLVCHTGSNELVNSNVEDIIDTKDVQTSKPDFAKGLNLLTEVLTVFQKNKENSKTSMLKDAGTSTEVNVNYVKPKLSISRTFNYCIGEFERFSNDSKFMIVDYCQPDVIKVSNNSLDLIRHKSSSIPQMKMDELKHAIRVKAKPKDAEEEVNRMFATIRKPDVYNLEDQNRPITRNGPRVLPVVKTELSKSVDEKVLTKSCKCSQTQYNLSGGDSASQCCRRFEETYERTQCCRYETRRNKRDTFICECCKKCITLKVSGKDE